MSDSAPQAFVEELADFPANADGARDGEAYAGPVADHIARLERRIEELEQRLDSRPARIQVGSQVIDDRPGLSIQDAAELIRAARGS